MDPMMRGPNLDVYNDTMPPPPLFQEEKEEYAETTNAHRKCGRCSAWKHKGSVQRSHPTDHGYPKQEGWEGGLDLKGQTNYDHENANYTPHEHVPQTICYLHKDSKNNGGKSKRYEEEVVSGETTPQSAIHKTKDRMRQQVSLPHGNAWVSEQGTSTCQKEPGML